VVLGFLTLFGMTPLGAGAKTKARTGTKAGARAKAGAGLEVARIDDLPEAAEAAGAAEWDFAGTTRAEELEDVLSMGAE